MKKILILSLVLPTLLLANNFEENLDKMEAALISSVESSRMNHDYYVSTLRSHIVEAQAIVSGLIYRKVDAGSLHVDDYDLESYFDRSMSIISKKLEEDITTGFLWRFKNVLLDAVLIGEDEGSEYFITVNVELLKQIRDSIKEFKSSNCGAIIF